jgi:hypothetical protein
VDYNENANSDTEFLTELDDDEDLLGLKSIGQLKQIKAMFITENDFYLSKIENSRAKLLRGNIGSG